MNRYKDFVNNIKIVYDEKSDEHFLNIGSAFFDADTSKFSKEEQDQVWMCHMFFVQMGNECQFLDGVKSFSGEHFEALPENLWNKSGENT